MKESNCLEDLGIDGMIYDIKTDLKKTRLGGCGLGSCGSEWGPMVGCHVQSNEYMDFTEYNGLLF